MRASAYEHLIPEKLFTDQTQPNAPQAISAVKALAIAASQGQKIYTITQANQDIILPQINVDPDVMNEMQNALSAGKEVTVHQSPITQSGWTGTGYIITDPATGAGAYKISGGANGGFIYLIVAIVFIVLAVALAYELFIAGIISATILDLALIGAEINYLSMIWGLYNINSLAQYNQLLAGTAITAVIGMGGSFLTDYFYGFISVLGPISQQLPITITNIVFPLMFRFMFPIY
jgi:hypothetical protein